MRPFFSIPVFVKLMSPVESVCLKFPESPSLTLPIGGDNLTHIIPISDGLMNQGHPNKKSSFKDGIKLKHKDWSDMDLLSGVWDPLKPRSGATWNLSQETVHCASQALGCKQEGRQHNLCLSRNTLTRNVQYSTQKHPMGSCEPRFPWKKIRNSAGAGHIKFYTITLWTQESQDAFYLRKHKNSGRVAARHVFLGKRCGIRERLAAAHIKLLVESHSPQNAFCLKKQKESAGE